MDSSAPTAASQIAPLLVLLIYTIFFGFIARMLAKDKGRKVTKWTVLGFIPGVNLYCLPFFIGASNLRQERKIDILLKARGQDPSQL